MNNPTGILGIDSDILSKDIEFLNLSIRRYNCLKYNKINTIGDLVELFKTGDISRTKNLGEKGIQEIKQSLSLIGIGEYYLDAIYKWNQELKEQKKKMEKEKIATAKIEDRQKRKQERESRKMRVECRRQERCDKISELLELGLSTRTCNSLARLEIYKKEELYNLIITNRIYHLPYIGKTGVEEILYKLSIKPINKTRDTNDDGER